MTSFTPKLLRAKNAASYLSISKSTFYSLVAKGDLPKGMALGKNLVLWHVDTLDKYADELKLGRGVK